MPAHLTSITSDYIEAVNQHDPRAYLQLFAADATVNDAGRPFAGLEQIAAWSQSDIFTPLVTLEVLEVVEDQPGQTVITTKVEGNFDRTGLPDPVIISHTLQIKGGKIQSLTCRLVEAKGP